jgi:hypothetical protein
LLRRFDAIVMVPDQTIHLGSVHENCMRIVTEDTITLGTFVIDATMNGAASVWCEPESPEVYAHTAVKKSRSWKRCCSSTTTTPVIGRIRGSSRSTRRHRPERNRASTTAFRRRPTARA